MVILLKVTEFRDRVTGDLNSEMYESPTKNIFKSLNIKDIKNQLPSFFLCCNVLAVSDNVIL